MSDSLADPMAGLSGRDQRRVRNYEGFSEAENLLGGSRAGRRAGNRASRIQQALSAAGIDVNSLGLDINEFDTPFTEDEASAATGYGRRAMEAYWKSRGVNLDRARHNFRTIQGSKNVGRLAAAQTNENQQNAEENIYPNMDRASSILNDLANKNAVSAEEESYLRTNISNQIKGAEESRMRRVAATLGLRGMDPSSPAGAAMAARTAEEADQMLVSSLKDLGLNVMSMNKDAMRQNAASLANLAISRAGLDNAIRSNDQALMRQVQSDVTALVDALYTRDKTWDFMMKQYEDATDESMVDRLNAWIGTAQSGVNLLQSITSGGLMGGGPGTAGAPTGTNDAGMKMPYLQDSSGGNQSPAGYGVPNYF